MKEHSDDVEHRVKPVKAIARGTESEVFKPATTDDQVSLIDD